MAKDHINNKKAVLVSSKEAALLEKAEDQIDLDLAEKAMKNLDGVPWEKVKKQLGL